MTGFPSRWYNWSNKWDTWSTSIGRLLWTRFERPLRYTYIHTYIYIYIYIYTYIYIFLMSLIHHFLLVVATTSCLVVLFPFDNKLFGMMNYKSLMQVIICKYVDEAVNNWCDLFIHTRGIMQIFLLCCYVCCLLSNKQFFLNLQSNDVLCFVFFAIRCTCHTWPSIVL